MAQVQIIRNLVMKYKYKLLITYALFSMEMMGSLLRFYFFGEAINDLIKGSYRGLIVLSLVHLAYLIVGIFRHMYDTRTYTAMYTSLVTTFISRRIHSLPVSKLSAHSALAREVVDFMEHDLVYMIEAAYNILGSLIILFFYDSIIVGICLTGMIPVLAVSFYYGKKMNRLHKRKNDEMERQVDVIATANKMHINRHYNNLRIWQIKISDKEAWNFGFMEAMVLLVIGFSLIFTRIIHSPAVMAGSILGIYSYIKVCLRAGYHSVYGAKTFGIK